MDIIETAASNSKPRNKWMIASIILSVLLILSVAYTFGTGLTGMVLEPEEEVGAKIIDYLNKNVQGSNPEILGMEEENGLFLVNMKIQGRPMDVYVTGDGKLLFPQIIKLDEPLPQQQPQQEQPTADIPKSDKPVVEAFIMSHCPYGTQIEKGLLPVAKLLGDKIDFNIKFVYYVMHGEKEVMEQLNQYCIQEEQNDKFLTYLECFLGSDNGEACLTEAGIDTNKLNTCTKATDTEYKLTENLNDRSSYLSGQFPLFNIHKEENEKYAIGGSPGLVINGQTVQSGRDPASLLNSICNAFNDAPEECQTELTSEQPSPGFGFGTTDSAAAGSCG